VTGRPVAGERVTSGCWLLWFRDDLPREVADAYWAGSHGDIVARVPHIVEYLQHHLAATGSGLWPATAGVGTAVPAGWRVDGMAEVRLTGTVGSILALAHMRELYLDEQRVFGRVLGHLSGPGRARWPTGPFRDTVGHRTVLLVRRRRGGRTGRFARYLHDELGPALLAAGATELRTHAFMPFTKAAHPTPGVAHDNPPHRRYHGAVVIGADSREHVDQIVGSAGVTSVRARQADHCVAVHAYSVAYTRPLIRGGRPIPI
jgi:hypothetical protein